ncbi:sushi, von Willebrand factor type A, EGF and pentraxin domain-containing protein 1-like isoform X2 [Ostrea edulis]|uniref:sushi, von Willebrand factor type A, EGF and pentraxin domain-containing protein 1-like isoform X2 n=1 Tax=Ostrea edulis TaxID=37623 RepID=UPI0024AF5CB0|nr:sushi, von Willebrand factor type A, EGF and pentraxin domain-containing protein 1-like isoform X2 [Ostrea edulis]
MLSGCPKIHFNMRLSAVAVVTTILLFPFYEVVADCGSTAADIVFILDSSGSVGAGNFQTMKKFFNGMVDGFQIGRNRVRIGSVPYSSSVHNTFQLNSYMSKSELKKKISEIPYDSGGTNTADAIKYVRIISFSRSYSRSSVAKIAVIITDGRSNDKSKTLSEARALRNSGVTIISVGVGDGVDASELRGMASKESYVFDVSTFRALDSIRKKLTETTCEVMACGNPGSPVHGYLHGRDFSHGTSVTYSCIKDYKLFGDGKRTCKKNGVWTGSLPKCILANACRSNPCQNNATCGNVGSGFNCNCVNGFTGAHCENDIQPPVVKNCPSDIRMASSSRFVSVTWQKPEFYDPFNHEVQVTSNYPNNGSSFLWGNYIAKYNALKSFNGLKSNCTFTIIVRPKPCKNLTAPKNGYLACNGWDTEFTRVCIAFCNGRTIMDSSHDIRTKYVCGGSGKWLPAYTENPPSCEFSRAWPRKDTRFYYLHRKSPKDDLNQIKKKYINILKKSAFKSLCGGMCKKENVDVLR